MDRKMMTQTHLVIAAALLAKPGAPARNRAAIAGALLPDLSIFVLFGWAVATGIPQETLWRETYWTEPWQTLGAISNSAPLWGLLALSLRALTGTWLSVTTVLPLAALTHIAGDFPLHNGDAHQHVWPVSDWRFHSPVSYWERDHFAGIVAPLEAILGAGLSIVLIRRFQSIWVRAVLASLVLAYLAVPVFFVLSLST